MPTHSSHALHCKGQARHIKPYAHAAAVDCPLSFTLRWLPSPSAGDQAHAQPSVGQEVPVRWQAERVPREQARAQGPISPDLPAPPREHLAACAAPEAAASAAHIPCPPAVAPAFLAWPPSPLPPSLPSPCQVRDDDKYSMADNDIGEIEMSLAEIAFQAEVDYPRAAISPPQFDGARRALLMRKQRSGKVCSPCSLYCLCSLCSPCSLGTLRTSAPPHLRPSALKRAYAPSPPGLLCPRALHPRVVLQDNLMAGDCGHLAFKISFTPNASGGKSPATPPPGAPPPMPPRRASSKPSPRGDAPAPAPVPVPEPVSPPKKTPSEPGIEYAQVCGSCRISPLASRHCPWPLPQPSHHLRPLTNAHPMCPPRSSPTYPLICLPTRMPIPVTFVRSPRV